MTKFFSLILLLAFWAIPSIAQLSIKGQVLSDDNSPVEYATVHIKETNIGSFTDENGNFEIVLPKGYKSSNGSLVVSAIGYDTKSLSLDFNAQNDAIAIPNITLKGMASTVDEVTVTASGVGMVKRSAYNSVVADTKELHNSTKSLGQALTSLPGVRIRESGGVGSESQIMLDGYSGQHVKVFIDGVPQEGAGAAMNLANLPVNYAERIEVYKGVVPVDFGADAIGGVVNVVTKKHVKNIALDASYSYGSFNTHKSHINLSHNLPSGLLYEINAFQNYSDNDYYIHNYVRTFTVNADGSVTKHPVDKNDIKRLKRFNDTYHNESIKAKIGLKDKAWADILLFSLAYSRFYKEIQTGVYQDIVFGQKHRHGYSWVPSVEYRKRNIFTDGLDISVNATYNHNITFNVDTAACYYNWLGQYYIKDNMGEQAYAHSRMSNRNWNITATANYRINAHHSLTANYIHSSFHRTTRSYIASSSTLSSPSIPKRNAKDIIGIAYKVVPSELWNATAFVKYYNQTCQGGVSENADGVGNYVKRTKSVNAVGYGLAYTYNILPSLQSKFSYELTYRLPTTDELFGDEDLEAGKTDLRPEKSNNLNLNINYHTQINKHALFFEGALIYRNTRDFIKRGIGRYGALQYGIFENHGHVITKGYNISARYKYDKWLNIGIAYNDANTRDYERFYTGQSSQKNVHYKDRLPNIPYRYANADASFTLHNLSQRDNRLVLSYDMMWQHSFPLYWESIGNKDTKNIVPSQCSHNVGLSYHILHGRYNFSVECSNITDAKLYDKFSLQRAGRAFYAKVRIHLHK
ncbi:MAG: TonB-dependent receptor [Bacteroidia bacterium]|nr:TonB-dependent receptor [Bacteroidia bacterium]